MIFTSVDLPAPLSPMRPSTSPGSSDEIDLGQRLDRAEMLRDLAELKNSHLTASTRPGVSPSGWLSAGFCGTIGAAGFVVQRSAAAGVVGEFLNSLCFFQAGSPSERPARPCASALRKAGSIQTRAIVGTVLLRPQSKPNYTIESNLIHSPKVISSLKHQLPHTSYRSPAGQASEPQPRSILRSPALTRAGSGPQLHCQCDHSDKAQSKAGSSSLA